MIPLRLAVSCPNHDQPFVARVNTDFGLRTTANDTYLTEVDGDKLFFVGPGGDFCIKGIPLDAIDGDVLLVLPARNIAHRLIRASSEHNTLHVTDGCDQVCVMCSQPPKPKFGHSLSYLETAALLAPPRAILGLSGGEPTLFKEELFDMLARVLTARTDLTFHILTNAQHFDSADLSRLRKFRDRITWGVPLYSTDPTEHNRIVGKVGAHHRLIESLIIFCKAGAKVELRTVLLQDNARTLPLTARFIIAHAPFVLQWAIMQLENIGYARREWGAQFYDSSIDFHPIGAALDISHAHGVVALLYNFPLCTVPSGYRKYAPPTISDWKRRYIRECDGCSERASCSGFFEWHPRNKTYEGVHRL